jgi:hypothetical protein
MYTDRSKTGPFMACCATRPINPPLTHIDKT